ncbi:hypothetical protein BaRGS_00000826, partial [Batillaria attramentaria]
MKTDYHKTNGVATARLLAAAAQSSFVPVTTDRPVPTVAGVRSYDLAQRTAFCFKTEAHSNAPPGVGACEQRDFPVPQKQLERLYPRSEFDWPASVRSCAQMGSSRSRPAYPVTPRTRSTSVIGACPAFSSFSAR